MTIQEAHNIINMEIRKDNESYVRPEDIDRALDRAQWEELSDLLGIPSEYQPGRPVARKGVGLNQRISDDLNPFVSTSTIATVSGVLSLPANYLYLLSLTLDDTDVPIPIYEYDKFANAVNSSIIAPTDDEPIAKWNGESASVQTLKLAPALVATDINVVYLRKPATPSYVYSINESTNVITHNAGASTDLEWNDIATHRIISRAISHLSMHLQDEYATRYAETQIAKGL